MNQEDSLYTICVEKDGLRCSKEGEVSDLPHPRIFGDKNKNEFISTGLSEQQLRIKTPICNSYNECYIKLDEITDVVLCELYKINEMLWSYSMPCLKAKSDYISGINIKFSINENLFNYIKTLSNKVPLTISDAYLKIIENFNKKAWMLTYLFGATPNSENKVSLRSSLLSEIIKLDKNSINICLFDLNPFEKCGISENQIGLLVAFLFNCLVDEHPYELNYKDVAKNGLTSSQYEVLLSEFDNLLSVNKLFNLNCKKCIEEIRQICVNNELTFIKLSNITSNDLVSLSLKNLEDGYNLRYTLTKYPKLASEAMVLIKDALLLGINYNVLNETISTVEFFHNGHKEYVIAGNKTNRDSYIFPIITDDKYIAKKIMRENNLNVPNGILLHKSMSDDEKNLWIDSFCNKLVVVKPRNTNYGTGINVFNKPVTKDQLVKAVDYAFTFDTDVLIEEYVHGMEYRFLVVDHKCISVAHRRNASVVGDGVSSIHTLIDAKNKEPWHYLTATPVKMDEPVEDFLKLQGYTFDSIPKKDERVFLRKNSNCSTGGESVDMTPIMPDYFKRISEEASRVFNAKICGVDIIIDDFSKTDYSIIEINDNPGYSINEWPYEGEGERVGISILKLLDLNY